jgi:hypothetical protein
MSNSSGSRTAGILLLIIGVIGIGFGIFYFTTDTSFLASDFGRHYTHGAGATVLGLFFVVVAIFLFRRKKEAPKPSQDLTRQKDKPSNAP